MSRGKHHRASAPSPQPVSNVQMHSAPSLSSLVSAHTSAPPICTFHSHFKSIPMNSYASPHPKLFGMRRCKNRGAISFLKSDCVAVSFSLPSCPRPRSLNSRLSTASLTPVVLMSAQLIFRNSFGMQVYVMTRGGYPPRRFLSLAVHRSGERMTLPYAGRNSAATPSRCRSTLVSQVLALDSQLSAVNFRQRGGAVLATHHSSLATAFIFASYTPFVSRIYWSSPAFLHCRTQRGCAIPANPPDADLDRGRRTQ